MKRLLSDLALWWLAVVTVCSATGCRSTVRVTDTPQTGSQQLLLNASIDAAVRCIDFYPLAERRVYLDAAGLEEVGDGYLIYRIREEMGLSGIRLAETRDDAEVIVEAGLAAYGTDSHNTIFGLTETDQLPEINLCVRDTQFGVAKLSLFAIERINGEMIWHSGPKRADAYQSIHKVLGAGPIFEGTVEHPANRIGRFASGTRSR